MDSSELLERARKVLQAHGLVADEINLSGENTRCGTEKEPYSQNGFYKIHDDFPPNITLINYQDGAGGETHTVSLYDKKELDAMSQQDRAALRERIERQKKENERWLEERRRQAAEKAETFFSSLSRAGRENPYLSRKGVVPLGDLRECDASEMPFKAGLSGRCLVVPVLNSVGRKVSLQFIDGEGYKRFLPGGEKKSNFFPVPAKDGSKAGPLLIGEGLATVLSTCMATDYAGLVAFDCGNLESVARMVRGRYPEREIILCADNDASTKGNPGLARAKSAAQAVAGKLALCPAIGGNSTDFNDLSQAQGLDAVKKIIEQTRAAAAVRLPNGFFLVDKGSNPGLYKHEVKGEDAVDLFIGPPLRIIGKTCDDSSDNWGTFLSWKDLAGTEHRWALPDDLLQGQGREYAQILARGGYSIAPGQALKFAAFIQGVKTDRFVTCVSRIGWHKDAYVMPDVAYGVPADTVVFQSAWQRTGIFRTSGTLDEWKKIPLLCAGNSRLVFALCAAFAGPLLQISGIEGGGFSFEGGSSSGKTTSLQVAASVWGGPEHVHSWRTTDNALEGVAALHNDNVLILDEVGQVNATVLSNSAYMLANGQSKGRAGREGKMRRVLTWQLLFLSSGELGLADKLAESGMKSRGGQEVRFVGIPVDKSMVKDFHGYPDAGVFVDHIKALCAEHYGHAGRKFLQWLCPRREAVGGYIRKHLAALVDKHCPPEATEQVRRVAKRFCLVLEAGLAAQSAGLVPKNLDIRPAVQSCFNDWIAVRGGSGASEDEAILSAVRLFIEQNGTSRFQDEADPDAKCINRVGFRHTEGDRTEYMVLAESFKKEVIKGCSIRRAGEVLRSAGWLQSDDGKNTTRRNLPGLGRVRVYVLTVPEEAGKSAIEVKQSASFPQTASKTVPSLLDLTKGAAPAQGDSDPDVHCMDF